MKQKRQHQEEANLPLEDISFVLTPSSPFEAGESTTLDSINFVSLMHSSLRMPYQVSLQIES